MLKYAAILGVALVAMPLQASAQTNALCTGLGEDERAEAAAFPHTLKLVFAAVTGEYVGEVAVKVTRASEVVYDGTCDGPWLMLNLPAGTYKVDASFENQSKSTTVSVGTRPSERTIAFKSAR